MLITVKIPKTTNKVNNKTCDCTEYELCEERRENAKRTKNRNFANCFKCEKYEQLKTEFFKLNQLRVCKQCGRTFTMIKKAKSTRDMCYYCGTQSRTRNLVHYCKPVYCLETKQTFENVNAAAKEFNYNPASLYSMINRKYRIWSKYTLIWACDKDKYKIKDCDDEK